MSHFTVLRTAITDTASLVKALCDVGFTDPEVHASPQHLYGVGGVIRPETAEVIIRREHIGRLSNDIGFQRQSDNTYNAIISEWDRRKYSEAWLNSVTQRYASHAARATLVDQGFDVVREEQTDGNVHLVLRRVT